MNRAEMRRKAREQEKCRLPLNFKMQLGQVAGLTGQQAMILQNYLKAREDEITEQATDACIREAQEKLADKMQCRPDRSRRLARRKRVGSLTQSESRNCFSDKESGQRVHKGTERVPV